MKSMAGEVVEGAEALVNGDGEAALFVPPLGGRALGWREGGDGTVVIDLGGGRDAAFGCPPDALSVGRERGRILLVEVDDGRPVSEAWIPSLGASTAR